jgi:hypothetical protein
MTVEQWEALSIEVHAREYPVLYVVRDEKSTPEVDPGFGTG